MGMKDGEREQMACYYCWQRRCKHTHTHTHTSIPIERKWIAVVSAGNLGCYGSSSGQLGEAKGHDAASLTKLATMLALFINAMFRSFSDEGLCQPFWRGKTRLPALFQEPPQFAGPNSL